MKKYRFLIVCVLVIVLCCAFAACGKAVSRGSINCENYFSEMKFSARFTVKYGSEDPKFRHLETEISIFKIGEKIEAQNDDLVVSVENGETLFVGVKSEADNGLTKPRVAIIKTEEDKFIQTAMAHQVKQGANVVDVYLDYGILDADYTELVKEENLDITGKKLKLKKGYDQAEVLRLYKLWNFVSTVDAATPNVATVTNTRFKDSTQSTYTFTFTAENGVNYLTIS